MLNIVNYIFVLLLNCINLPVPQLSKSSIMSNQALFGSLRKVLKYYLKYFTLLTKPQIVLADKSEGWNFRMKSKPRNTEFDAGGGFFFIKPCPAVSVFLSYSAHTALTIHSGLLVIFFLRNCSIPDK